jgi:hypothetical protein
MFDKYSGAFLHIVTNRFAARIAHSVLFFDKYTESKHFKRENTKNCKEINDLIALCL